jgi:hypothetical protein
MNLKESIEFVGKNKHKAAIFVKKIGVVTFSMCRELINNGDIDNEGNRDEDLDTPIKYYGKVHHLIRYMSGISEKGQLLISILKDSVSKVGYIRDNGTMFSLTFGKYYENKVLTGNDWLFMCTDIIDNYDITNEDDKYVINLIRNFFESKKEEQLAYAYSLKEVVESSVEFKEFYDGVEIGFVVSLQTTRQFEKDMMNCNRQPNPWLAYNYYMTPLKRTNEYKTHYCGDELLEYFTDKVGADIFSKGKLIFGHSSYAEKHKVAKMIPILQAYIGSHYCETIDDFKKFNDMIIGFENGKDDGKETKYWRDVFQKVISEVSYTTITEWYEKQYKVVFESEDWNEITTQINKIVTDKNKLNGSKVQSMEDLHIKKYHTGIFLMAIVLYFKRKYSKLGIAKLTTKVTSEYVRLLNGDVKHNNEKIPVWKYFGTERDIYKSTSADVRWEKIFQYIFKNVESDIKNRSKDRDNQAEYRDNVLKRISAFCDSEKLASRLKLFPLSTDNICVINFSTGDGIQWLHKTPHSTGGDAKDGFLGMTDDNLDGNQKYKNWDCTPNEYWLMVAERNEKILETLTGVDKKLVEQSINSIYQLVDTLDLAA